MPFRARFARLLAGAIVALPPLVAACSAGDVGGGGSAGGTGVVISVQVSPARDTITSGATQALTATLRDAAGNLLTGRAVSWTTSDPSIATVSDGTVAALASGNATITATSEGQSGTAAVTVATPAPPPPAAECATPKPGWIWCDDFEQDRTSRYFEYDNAGGNFTRAGGVGLNGSSGMLAHWTVGAQNAGALHLAFGRTPSSYFVPVDAGIANYREVYWRMYVKHQAGWVGSGPVKLSRGFVFATSNWAQAAVGHVWSGTSLPQSDHLIIDPVSGTDASGNLVTTTYNDFANFHWLGSGQSTTPMFDMAHAGQWYCVEAHMRLNTAGSSDGLLEVWINGSLETQRSGLNFLGSYSQYGINAVFFENYWNAGAPTAEDRYFDNLVVSTGRIGCTS